MTNDLNANINLDAVTFARHEEILVRHGALKVVAYRYASGVKALRVENGVGTVVLLPYQGQQIWDAVFHGRRLTMRSMFDEPVDTTDYLGNYGGFLLHCGATGMGNVGPGDSHALHGELPSARFQNDPRESRIECLQRKNGRWAIARPAQHGCAEHPKLIEMLLKQCYRKHPGLTLNRGNSMSIQGPLAKSAV